jgi:hypothetical protein
VSNDLATKLRLGLQELSRVRDELVGLTDLSPDSASVIERSAACAMLHSFYTEIEKLLRLIAEEYDGRIPRAESWHRELLRQMGSPTAVRAAVLSAGSVEALSEFLAFRHLFRGASILLMRWDKLAPLLGKVARTHAQTTSEIEAFIALALAPPPPDTAA